MSCDLYIYGVNVKSTKASSLAPFGSVFLAVVILKIELGFSNTIQTILPSRGFLIRSTSHKTERTRNP